MEGSLDATRMEKMEGKQEPERERDPQIQTSTTTKPDELSHCNPTNATTSTPEDTNRDTSIGSDEEFQDWIFQELQAHSPQVYALYPTLMKQCAIAVTKWRQRYRGNVPLWNRVFKRDRVLKEVVESIPVLDVVQEWMKRRQNTEHQSQSEDVHGSEDDKRMVILDLCSGKGYLSMLLSEILSDQRQSVEKCLLVDKAWPLCHAKPQAHHMSWEHIYGDTQDETSPKYFETWPIPLVTSKQDLKQSRTIREFQERFQDHKGPILILAVHLCGTLSLQAIKLFQALPNVPLILLKPCCLPDIWHAKHSELFHVGSYSFPTVDVCSSGRWTTKKKQRGRWDGPPRWHLEEKFHVWCHYLQEAMQHTNETRQADSPNEEKEQAALPVPTFQIETKVLEVPLQTNGGYQNTFLLAERLAA